MNLQNNNFNKNIEEIVSLYQNLENQNKYLREELRKLKEEYSKDEEIKKMQEQVKEMREDNLRGFPISKKEEEKIKEWTDKHIREKHWDFFNNRPMSFGAIGGNFTYHFIPTSIGTIGEIKCSCGECFTFQEMD